MVDLTTAYLSSNCSRTLTLCLSCPLHGTQGSSKGPPQLSVPGQFLDGASADTQAPHLYLHWFLKIVKRKLKDFLINNN